ncbi:MAG: hypothetical protein H7330_00605 [Hymenobacteraceae bacterium]|nr:hypothetical protein [Hymenobacteraceae bacterium]
MKFLLLLFVAGLLSVSARAQVLRSATDRAAQIYWYQQSLNERATKEAREIGRVLGLNESEVQLVRQFAASRLQSENEAQALIVNDVAARREAQERASAQFQTRLVNTLNESQMQRYFQLLAETASPSNPGQKLSDDQVPAITTEVIAPLVVIKLVPAEPAAKKPVRPYAPIGTYHRPTRRR